MPPAGRAPWWSWRGTPGVLLKDRKWRPEKMNRSLNFVVKYLTAVLKLPTATKEFLKLKYPTQIGDKKSNKKKTKIGSSNDQTVWKTKNQSWEKIDRKLHQKIWTAQTQNRSLPTMGLGRATALCSPQPVARQGATTIFWKPRTTEQEATKGGALFGDGILNAVVLSAVICLQPCTRRGRRHWELEGGAAAGNRESLVG
jgi:hypothetical protein